MMSVEVLMTVKGKRMEIVWDELRLKKSRWYDSVRKLWFQISNLHEWISRKMTYWKNRINIYPMEIRKFLLP